MKTFNLPDLGEGLAEAEIREWYIKEGDTVTAEQPLVAVETAKALVDVPSPQDGKIAKLFGQAGDIIKTGAPLLAFETTATDNIAPTLATRATDNADTGTVVGRLETQEKILKEAAVGVEKTTPSSNALKITPALRVLAKELDIDLTKIKGSGPDNSITIQDLKKVLTLQPSSAISHPTIQGEALHSARRSMALAMTKSHQEVVPVTLMDYAIITHWPEQSDITLRLVRAIVNACQAEPALNAHFDGHELTRQLFSEIHLGLALDTGDHLYVPVIKNAERQTDNELRKEIDRFKAYGQQQHFPPEMLKGATICLSNFGMYAGRYATPIIVPPMVAILATGKKSLEVLVNNNQPSIQAILPLSLTFDHRAVTGAESARFLKAIITNLQQ